MPGIAIRLIKALLLVVPLMVAVVECNDEEDDKDVSYTPHQVLPELSVSSLPGVLIVDLVDGSTEWDLYEIENLLGSDFNWVHEDAWDEALAAGEVSNLAAAIETLANHPLVEVVEPRMTMHTTSWVPQAGTAVNDPLYPKQWHLDAMGAPYGWANTPQGKGIIVAVADTGVTVVADLKDTHILEGRNFSGGNSKDWTDRQGHGTHVAGTIAQSTNNSIGTAGVAPKATILPVKVLSDHGSGSADGIAAGIDWAVDNGAQVINLSLGGGYSAVIHNAITKATEKGVLVIAACGNDGRPECGYPGQLKETIGVSATGPNGELSFYSSHGKGVDIAAPGGDKGSRGDNPEGGVLQATIDGDYDYFQGTSMATPHVAGAAAILLSTGATPKEVEEILLTTADGDTWTEPFGHGKLNLKQAVLVAGGDSTGRMHQHASLFAIAGLFGLALSIFAETSRRFMFQIAITSAFVGGGFWFLPDIPFANGVMVDMLSTPLLEWPNVIVYPGAANFPLWSSAVIPLIVTFLFGLDHRARSIAGGIAIGMGANLLWAAAAGTILPWALPGIAGTIWLTVNGIFALILGLGTIGAHNLETSHNAR